MTTPSQCHDSVRRHAQRYAHGGEARRRQRNGPLISREDLQMLACAACGEYVELDAELVSALQRVTEDLVEDIVGEGCSVAKARKSDVLRESDMYVFLRRRNMDVKDANIREFCGRKRRRIDSKIIRETR